MKKNLKSYLALTILTLLVLGTIAFAMTIYGPGSADGSQGTYFWYRDSKGTAHGEAWRDRGHLSLFAGRTYTFEWNGIDDSGIYPDNVLGKEAWQVFVLDAGEGSHGWEQIAIQTRKDEPWVKNAGMKVLRLFVNWGFLGQTTVPAGAKLDLRLVLRQNTGDDKWHIEAWCNDGSGWTLFFTGDDIDISTAWSGLPGYLTQACAGIQVDADTAGPLHFHPAAPRRR